MVGLTPDPYKAPYSGIPGSPWNLPNSVSVARGPASVAQTLYRESDQARAVREQAAAERRADALVA